MPSPSDSNSIAQTYSTDASLAVMLRKATADAHERIEQLPLMMRLTSAAVTREDYAHYLTVIASVYRVVEAALYRGLDPSIGERLGLRPKIPALMRDLTEQGVAEARLKTWDSSEAEQDAPYAPKGADAIVGGLYVLEGATLGGRTIARHLRRCLGPELGSAAFLDFHGEGTSAAWKRFAATLDELCAEGVLTPDAVIAGALAAFANIHHRLSEVQPLH